MKAIISRTAGGPETLEVGELPEPKMGPKDVLIAVRACGVNYPDVLIIKDMYQFKPPRPFAPGAEVAGEVLDVGPEVSAIQPGERVMAFTVAGGMAERIALPENQCIPLHDSMPFDEAAGFAMTYGTSYYALKNRGDLRNGETLLVLGAAGGVGLAAVELGKAMGARVIAAVSSEEKAATAKKCGADATVIYPRDVPDAKAAKALSEQFKLACGPSGANVIYDPVGGNYAEAALRAIAWEGRFLVVGFPAGIPSIALNLPLLKNCQIVGVFFGAFCTRDPVGYRQMTRDVMDLYAKGAIRPHISAKMPLARAGEAIKILADRKALGKLVVTIG